MDLGEAPAHLRGIDGPKDVLDAFPLAAGLQPAGRLVDRVKEPAAAPTSVDVSTKMLNLRRPDLCVTCGRSLPAGTQAQWDSEARTVTCRQCVGGPVECAAVPAVAPEQDAPVRPSPGVARASALREYERRKENREKRTRERHPHIGGLLLALRQPPQHETAFRQGARGEAAVAASLEKRAADAPAVLLYDRRMPGGCGNIDILAIAPSGIYVIDAKDHKGKVSIATPLWGSPQLRIAGRGATHLLDGLDRQVAAVRAALASSTAPEVHGVLCFTRADLPLLGRKIRSHLLLYRKQVAKRLNGAGPLSPRDIADLATSLANGAAVGLSTPAPPHRTQVLQAPGGADVPLLGPKPGTRIASRRC